MCMSVLSIHMYVHHMLDWYPKRRWMLWDWKCIQLWTDTQMLGIKPGSSRGAAGTLHHQVIPSPHSCIGDRVSSSSGWPGNGCVGEEGSQFFMVEHDFRNTRGMMELGKHPSAAITLIMRNWRLEWSWARKSSLQHQTDQTSTMSDQQNITTASQT